VSGDPLVEALLLRRGDRLSLALTNWGYRGAADPRARPAVDPIAGLTVNLDPSLGVTSARALAQRLDLAVARAPDGRTRFVLPRLAEGEVLALGVG
ncbi:MAG: hypothetical protein FJ104_11685, partial [Deltaproteobacteria bacterium]|nr:hypothetical protein [Deltaproteobacteria bacterium]